jgi:cytochrome c553
MKRLLLVVIAAVVAIMFCAPLYAQDPAAGKQVFDREKCSVCHNAKLNPLDGVGTKLTADQIRGWIENPAEAAKTSKSTSKLKMTKKNLSKGDVDSLVAYLQTMKAAK